MKKILVIEDEPEMRRNLATILKLEKFEVVAAEDGTEGVVAAKRENPDLILCDVMMPGMDGYQVLQALREHPPTMLTPFVFLTAKGEKADFRAGMNLGADDYLTKPVARVDLLNAITARLKRNDQQSSVALTPNFDSPEPLHALGLTPRVAEVLLWVAQGKNQLRYRDDPRHQRMDC